MASRLSTDLLALVRHVARTIDLPAVKRVVAPLGSTPKEGDFGLLVLDDDSIGLFFVRLDETLAGLGRREAGAAPLDPLTLAEGASEEDPAARALALGAINAISQHVMRRAGLELPAADSLGGMVFDRDDRVGMVGLFPSLARRLLSEGVDFTVVEKRSGLAERWPGCRITSDPAALAGCSKILITASTLLNDTLDDILVHCPRAAAVSLIGPSAGCLPDPLFERGIDAVGGTAVVRPASLPGRLECGEPWGDAVRKYLLRREHYPGVAALLQACRTGVV